jgi:hypothetical protein
MYIIHHSIAVLLLLRVHHRRVDSILVHELLVGALLEDCALVEEEDAVGLADRAETVGHDYYGCVEGGPDLVD